MAFKRFEYLARSSHLFGRDADLYSDIDTIYCGIRSLTPFIVLDKVEDSGGCLFPAVFVRLRSKNRNFASAHLSPGRIPYLPPQYRLPCDDEMMDEDRDDKGKQTRVHDRVFVGFYDCFHSHSADGMYVANEDITARLPFPPCGSTVRRRPGTPPLPDPECRHRK